MNTTSNNNTRNTSDNTHAESGGTGAGHAGSSVRGVFDVIHGVGENIRGTALGAVDTITKSHNTSNDEIAQRGRFETQSGMAKIRGGSHSSHDQSESASSYPTESTSGTHALGTGRNAGHGTEAGFEGSHDTHTSTIGSQHPLGAGAAPYNATGATQGQKPYPTTQRSGDADLPGMATPESTVYPSQHREDTGGAMPGSQLHEVHQSAYDDPYHPTNNPRAGTGLNQPQQAYGNTQGPV